MKPVAILAALALLAAAPPPAIADAAPLSPSGPWAMELSSDACTMTRSFGTGADAYTIGITPLPYGSTLILTLISPHRPRTSGNAGAVGFGEDPAALRYYYLDPRTTDRVHWVFRGSVDSEPFFAGFANAARLTVTPGGEAHTFQLRATAAAKAALDSCVGDLLARWGMAKSEQAAVAIPPRGEINTLFDYTDYPTEAVRANQQGVVGARFWVGVDGRATDCVVFRSSGAKLLDQQTCAVIVKRARLSPARGRLQRPVRSLSSAEISWIIPTG